MSIGVFAGDKKQPVLKADNLTTILGHCHIIWEPYLPGTLWAPQAYKGTNLLFLFTYFMDFDNNFVTKPISRTSPVSRTRCFYVKGGNMAKIKQITANVISHV